MASVMCLPATLAARRQRVQPTAIGLTLPSFLVRALTFAPKKKDQTAFGVLPWRMTLTREVSAVNSTGPPTRPPVMSFRCWGLNLSAPPAELFGKEKKACATTASENEGERLDSARGGGIWDSRCGGGCFCLRTARVLSFLSATESSEQARQTVPL